MKDLVLINSPDEFYVSQIEADPKMPLGLLYIESYVRSKGFSTNIIDAHTNNFTEENIISLLQLYQPRLIGLNCTSPNRKVVFDLVKSIKSALPASIVIVGGPHATSMPEDFFENAPCIDGLVIGEGEETVVKILQNINNYEKIPGFYTSKSYFAGEQKTYSERLTALDDLPFPNFDALEIDKYLAVSNSLYITCTRGCRYDCAFCSVRVLLGKSVQYRSADNVVDEMKALNKKFGVTKFNFYDDDLLMWPELADFCKKNEGTNLYWTAQATINDVKPDQIELLSKGGCISLSFGFESGSYKIQKFVAKVIKEKSIALLPKFREHNIISRGYFIIGFPLETLEDIAETMLYLVKLKFLGLDDIAVFSARPYPGTRLFDQCISLYGESKRNEILDFYYADDYRDHEEAYIREKMRRYNTLPSFQVNHRFNSKEIRVFVSLAFHVFKHAEDYSTFTKNDFERLLLEKVESQLVLVGQ